MTKTCSKCKESKTLDLFIKRKASKDGRTSECKSCHKLASKTWEETNKDKRYTNKRNHEKRNPEKTKARKYKAEYGITLEEYESILASQNNCCAICGKHRSQSKIALHTDHNHTTGKVRGILCQKCNRGLGFFNDDPELLITASTYLKSK